MTWEQALLITSLIICGLDMSAWRLVPVPVLMWNLSLWLLAAAMSVGGILLEN
jgi:hypothetical protein